MTVTGMQPLDNKRTKIWIDEEFAFVLYKGELRRFNVREGDEISDKTYSEIIEQLLPRRAKLRAMNLLKSHTYSVNQLRNKLREGFYPDGAVEAALSYVAAYGYTDDLRLSEEFIRIHISDKSRQRIVQDLAGKGISKEIIDKAFNSCAEYGFEQDELMQAKRLLKKRGYNPEESDSIDIKEKAKHYAFLARKGYSSSVIRSAMESNDFDDLL